VILQYASRAVARHVRARLASNPVVTRMVTWYDLNMQVIARRTLREFWARYPHAEGPIRAWVAVAAKARWANPAEVKRQFGSTVDFVGDNRVIFDLGGNKYRLVVHVSFSFGRLLVKFISTHAEYDRIDPETVSWRRK
jgi:mRNA interferase HigB